MAAELCRSLDQGGVVRTPLERSVAGYALRADGISEISGTAMSDPADMILWADQAIDLRFTVQRTSWQCGPTDCQDSLTLYSDIQGDLVVKDLDKEIMETILRMY
jgi:hypothetical protein